METTLSAWDVYWVMQADTIHHTANGCALVSTMAVFLGAVIVCASYEELMFPKPIGLIIRRVWLSLIPIAFLSIIAATFLPTTKTVAAIIVLPAIANNEQLHGEAEELYHLAKEALTDMVKKDDKPNE